MYKKIVHGHRTSCAQKRVIILFNVHIVIIVQKRHCSFGKSSIFACNYVKSLALSGAKYGISEIIGINLSVVNIF